MKAKLRLPDGSPLDTSSVRGAKQSKGIRKASIVGVTASG